MSGPAPASAFVPVALATSSAHPVPHVVDRHTRRIVAAFGIGPDGDIVDRSGPDGMPGAESRAYARLFAAAPDLHAALREAESEFDGAVRFYRNEMAGFVGASIVERLEACARKARAALRKAEGGAS